MHEGICSSLKRSDERGEMQRILTNFTVLSPVSNLRSTSQSRAGVHSSSCSICVFIFLGGWFILHALSYEVYTSICLVICACVDMTPGPSKHKYILALSPFLSLYYELMMTCTGYLFLCVISERVFQTFNPPVS